MACRQASYLRPLGLALLLLLAMALAVDWVQTAEAKKDKKKSKKNDDKKDVKSSEDDSNSSDEKKSGTKKAKQESPAPYPPGMVTEPRTNVPPFNPNKLQPTSPTLFRAPPDFKAPPDYLAPFPPFPPALAPVKLKNIRSPQDVCDACLSVPFTPGCNNKFAPTCLAAIKAYNMEVLGIADNLCSCYNSVANLLIDFCPGISTSVSYLGNCDSFCFYGVPCPFNPTIYSLLSPRYVALAQSSSLTSNKGKVAAPSTLKPAPTGSAVVTINLMVAKKPMREQVCFRLVKSRKIYGIQSLAIKRGIIGQTGQTVVPFFANGQLPARGRGCADTSVELMTSMSTNATSFYLEMNTLYGAVRGQLVANPSLITAATSQNAGAPCTGKVCLAVAALTATHYSISYRLSYLKSIKYVRAANIAMGQEGGAAGIKVVDFFGPGSSPRSDANSVTPYPDTILSILADPGSYYMNITTAVSPFGALRGQFFDSLRVFALLYGYQVKPVPSGVGGTGVFLAQIGAGGICYEFKFQNVPYQPQYAYLHQASYTQAGQITLFETLNVVPGITCLQADTSVTSKILGSANSYYVQVYSDAFPTTKLLRGQLYITPVSGQASF